MYVWAKRDLKFMIVSAAFEDIILGTLIKNLWSTLSWIACRTLCITVRCAELQKERIYLVEEMRTDYELNIEPHIPFICHHSGSHAYLHILYIFTYEQ